MHSSPPIPGGMADPPPWIAWLASQGIGAPVDFCYAFTSADEVRAAAGAEASEAWTSLRRTTTVPSSWALYQARAPRASPPQAEPAPLPVLRQWTGVSRRPRGVPDLTTDQGARFDAASAVWDLVMTWGARCTIVTEYHSLHPDDRPDWKQAKLAGWTRFEARTVRSYLRTWSTWARWCATKGVDCLTAQSHLEEFLYSPGPGSKSNLVAPSVPRARW